MALFDEFSAQKRLIYVHAPAGYGKTFSARMWLSRANRPSAWVAVSESAGRKTPGFYERFALALLTLQPDNFALKDLLEQKTLVSFSFIEQALKIFTLHAIKSGKQKAALVIDDLHFITSGEINRNLPDLINLLPENITLFLLSRTEPPENFSAFIVKDLIAVAGADKLKFSENEIQSLFASRNRRLTPQQSHNVLAATGGWAIGLNAVLLPDNHQYGDRTLSRYLDEYIKKEIWARWDKERQDFMLRVSVAGELTPDFCDAMTGRKDSAEVLDALVRENAFISADKENVYRFHNLFQDFLVNLPEHGAMKNKLYNMAGDWFYGRADYYKAVEYYIKCNNKSGIAKSVTLMRNHNSPYASVEDTAAIIRLAVNDSVINEYPFMLEALSWADFAEGRSEEMEGIKQFARADTPSITLNMPFFHRSSRDYSEFLSDEENSFDIFRKTWGVLLKGEYEVVEKSLRACFAYEQGELEEAQEYALSAAAAIKGSFSPEAQFCAFMILAAVMDARNNRGGAKEALDTAADMIKQRNAYYLYANFQAYICRQKLNNGDTNAAKDWLAYNAEQTGNNLPLYKLYRHFTTARAFIVTGNSNQAILLLKKILALSGQYRRPLDIIEADILLAAAYWKDGRYRQALAFMERAVALAYQYGYTQIFANEGAAVMSMLHRLQKRAVQQNYSGNVPGDFIKTLYIGACAASKNAKGLTGGETFENHAFTEKQKTVMRFMCKGFSRKEIAEKMGLKPYGVKSHIELIYKKLDVCRNMDAVIKINELGLLKE